MHRLESARILMVFAVAAQALVATASQPNLRVLVDALHWARAGDDAAGIRAALPVLGAHSLEAPMALTEKC